MRCLGFKTIKNLSLSINDQNRLSALSLMHINVDIDIDTKSVLKIFCERDRVLEFEKICA